MPVRPTRRFVFCVLWLFLFPPCVLSATVSGRCRATHPTCPAPLPAGLPCIQRHRFTEADYRGERFKDFHKDIKGNNDILSLTQVREKLYEPSHTPSLGFLFFV